MKIIYALSDPRTGRIRYIGYTKNFASRMHYHYRHSKYSWNKKAQCLAQTWLYELADIAMLPLSHLLEVIEDGMDWQERERYWIAHFKELGEPLLNGTVGGFGSKGRKWSLTEEQRKAISVRNKKAWANRPEDQREAALNILAQGRKKRHGEGLVQ